MDPRLACLADYVTTLSEIVALLEEDREDSKGVRFAWTRADELLVHYQELEAAAGMPSAQEVEELRVLARRATGLNAVAVDLAAGCLGEAKRELERCRLARGRLRPAADEGSVGDYCDLAG